MEEKGVWRTVRGRRVFIKEGQSLTDAMKESGKFKNLTTTKKYSEMSEEEFNKELDNISKEREKNTKERVKFEEEHLEDWQEYSKDKNLYTDDKEDWLNENYPEYKKLNNEFQTIDKKYYELWDIKENKTALKRLDKINEIKDSHKFYSDTLSDSIDNISAKDSQAIAKANGLVRLDDILKDEGLVASESPYSFSTYGIKEGEEVTWGSKPVNSYRLSDHWNFDSRGATHCKLTGVNEYTQKVILAKYNGDTYDIVEEFND